MGILTSQQQRSENRPENQCTDTEQKISKHTAGKEKDGNQRACDEREAKRQFWNLTEEKLQDNWKILYVFCNHPKEN
jgi:hypothetical protein